MNDLASAGALAAEIDSDLTTAISNLLYDHMESAKTQPWCVDFDELTEVIGSRYAYRSLSRRRFDPDPGDGGNWYRAACVSVRPEDRVLHHVDVKALTRAFQRAIKALDPCGLCRPLLAGAA